MKYFATHSIAAIKKDTIVNYIKNDINCQYDDTKLNHYIY